MPVFLLWDQTWIKLLPRRFGQIKAGHDDPLIAFPMYPECIFPDIAIIHIRENVRFGITYPFNGTDADKFGLLSRVSINNSVVAVKLLTGMPLNSWLGLPDEPIHEILVRLLPFQCQERNLFLLVPLKLITKNRLSDILFLS